MSADSQEADGRRDEYRRWWQSARDENKELRAVVEELREAAGEFLDAYVSAQRDIPADDLERLDEAEIALRAALASSPPAPSPQPGGREHG